jgi:hypothetical protein
MFIFFIILFGNISFHAFNDKKGVIISFIGRNIGIDTQKQNDFQITLPNSNINKKNQNQMINEEVIRGFSSSSDQKK